MSAMQHYDCRISKNRVVPARLDGREVPGFRCPATRSGVEKLYVVKTGDEFSYVGITSQAMSARFRYGFNPNTATGYHGYAWRHLDEIDLYVWPARWLGRDQIEAIEAELVFLIREATGRWPIYQTEIHFHNPPANMVGRYRWIAKGLFDRLRRGDRKP